jgi:hypothetical protein
MPIAGTEREEERQSERESQAWCSSKLRYKCGVKRPFFILAANLGEAALKFVRVQPHRITKQEGGQEGEEQQMRIDSYNSYRTEQREENKLNP